MRMRLARRPEFICAVMLAAVCIAVFVVPLGTRASAVQPSSLGPTPASSSPAIIDADLVQALGKLAPADQTSVIVYLRDQANPNSFGGNTRAERQRNLIIGLQQKAQRTQARLLSLLRGHLSQGSVSSARSLWITNAIALTGTASAITWLAQQPEVGRITTDATFMAPTMPRAATSSSPVAPNISQINAPALWQLGFQGQGMVIASMDTGVDVTQPDLAAQWRGGTNSWYDPYGQHPSPTDISGHGTWTMGVMVGRNGSGTSIGVAPRAEWIAAKIFNDRGVATTSAIHQAYQWLLDPDGNPNTPDAPNVVNDSWTYSNTNGCDQTFEPDLQSLAAAGIVSVFAAGNYGPNGSTSVSPSNNPDALAVGGVDNQDANDPESSRGPTSCGTASRTYPDVVAPDVNIVTTDLGGTYTTATGTSMAAPEVTGGLALLLNAFPTLTASQQRTALTASAVDLGPAGPDNEYGAGRIDLLAAYNLVASGALPTPTPAPSPTPTNSPTPTPLPTSTSTPPPTGSIFADGFESGNLSAWSATGGTASDLSVTAAAAQSGAYGMVAAVSGGSSGYVQDNSPSAETIYHARFYVNPNSASVTTTAVPIFVGLTGAYGNVFTVQLRQYKGAYQVSAVVARSSGTTATGWFTISGSSFTAVEIAWQSGVTASFSLYAGGTLRQTLTGLNTSALTLETVRLGPQGGLSNVSGALYLDTFASNRTGYIGL